MTSRPASPVVGTTPRIARTAMWPVRAVPALAVLLVVVGFAFLGLGWRSAAATLDLQVQMAYLLSGGLLGLTLLGVGCGLAVVQADRWATREVARATRDLARSCRRLEQALAEPGSPSTSAGVGEGSR